MNLVDFWVKDIIKEEKGKMYELMGYTEEEMNNEEEWWKEYLLSNGLKQIAIIVDIGGEQEEEFFFNLDKGDKPYEIGHKGVH